MSNGFIYVVDAHFIDKIEKKKISWTQVPVYQRGTFNTWVHYELTNAQVTGSLQIPAK
jgi:hypothetical protein